MKVLLVEDSRVVRAYVEAILRSASDVALLPTAGDGREAIDRVIAERPDVVLMDLELPVLDGISAIREIMRLAPCPVVVLSAYLEGSERDRTFESFEAGAVEVLAKPSSLAPDAVVAFRERLLRTTRLMAQARVVRRWSSPRLTPVPARQIPPSDDLFCSALVIGASTGGPLVVHAILAALAPPAPVPIAIAQHIVPGFEHGFADWLSGTGHRVVVARGGEPVSPGVVVVAPADCDLVIDGDHYAIECSDGPGPRPSIDRLFFSAAKRFGASTVAVLLSGMGDDGANGLADLARRGALTITQKGSTCAVDGMPAAARALGASTEELAPEEIARRLRMIADVETARTGKLDRTPSP